MDDLVLEVRKTREAYAKQFGYDLRAIHRDLKEQEKISGRKVVSFPPRRPAQNLRGSVIRYERPTDPVGEKQWEASR